MKRFLYAAMVVSLGITSLGFIGCGKKKEAVKTSQNARKNDMTNEELLAAIRMINDEDIESEIENDLDDAEENLEEAEANIAHAQEDLDEVDEDLAEVELEDELEDELENLYANMTPEEIEEAERQAMEELAALIAQEQEERSRNAMGPDAFDPNLNTENMSDEERKQLEEWQQTAAEWAKQELALAAQESSALGFERIEFEKNSSTMLPGQEAALAQNIKCARTALENNHDLVIGGYAEADAPKALELSNARAAVLRDALIAAGLPGEYIHAAGYGAYSLDAASQSAADVIVC